MTIEYPKQDEHAALRRILEAAAQATPVTAAFAHLFGYAYPGAFEEAKEAYLRDLGSATNDHSERLTRLEQVFAPRAVISPLAALIALQMLTLNRSGRPDAISFDEIVELLPGKDRTQSEEAVSELKHRGYVETVPVLGSRHGRVRPTLAMFLAFDKSATGNDTRLDAIEIAKTWLLDPSTTSVDTLASKVGWEPRRLNPALMALRDYLPNATWSNEIHQVYAETYLALSSDEKFSLKELITSGRVD
jgi:hypothetical protein